MKFFLVSLFFIFLFCLPEVSFGLVNNSLCTPQGSFVTPNKDGFYLDSAEVKTAEKALAWIYRMMEPLGTQAVGGDIRLSQNYPFEHSGQVAGSYKLDNNLDYPPILLTHLEVIAPASLTDTYRGVVSGRIKDIKNFNEYYIRAYLFTDAEYLQDAVAPAEILSDGSWSIDLSDTPTSFSGAWHFRLYNKGNNVQVGKSWPQPVVRKNLDVALYSVTDQEYFIERKAAPENGIFEFTESSPGTKRLKLINNKGTISEADDIVLSVHNGRTGIIRSYELFPEDEGYGTSFQERGYVYDQALALSASLVSSNISHSKDLVTGLVMFQGGNGGFNFSAPQLAPSATDPIFRTGAHSIALYSLLQYIEKYPNDLDINSYKNSALNALEYLEGLKSKEGKQQGLYVGGSGRYVQDVFEVYTIPWASTEHNLDTLHALQKAAVTLKDKKYELKAKDLGDVIIKKLWNPDNQRFYQGYSPQGPDPSDALDVSSWGSIALSGLGDYSKSLISLDRLDVYENKDILTGITGWAPYSSRGGYPEAIPTVWFEGSFGVLLSYARNNLSESYGLVLDNLKKGQLESGAFPYATTIDKRYEIGTASSIASTAWYILSTVGRDTFWSECKYIQEEDLTSENNLVVKPSFRKICSDLTALNYSQSAFGISDETFCLYAEKKISVIDDMEKKQSISLNAIENILEEKEEDIFYSDVGLELSSKNVHNEDRYILLYTQKNKDFGYFTLNPNAKSVLLENISKKFSFKEFLGILYQALLNFFDFFWSLLVSLFFFIINLFK